MICEICSKFNKNPVYNDCVIEYLEKIKLHYNCLKTDFQNAKSSSIKLEIENENLRKKISTLESMDNNNLSLCKRRKKNSLTPENHDNNTDNVNVNKKSSTPISKELSEELNKAMNITEVNWSDTFYSQTNNNITSTPKKNSFSNSDRDETPDLSPRKILSPNNNRKNRNSPSLQNKSKLLSSPNSSSSLNHSRLPRRLKSSSSFISKPKQNIENQNPAEINTKWISKESKTLNTTINHKHVGLISSFIQSSDKIVTNSSSKVSPKISSDDKSKQQTIIKSPRKSLSFKKFRQQRLLFDIIKDDNQKQSSDNDETFCDDIIQPSPTSVTIPYAEDGSKTKKKSLINFSRKKFENNLFDFSSPKKTTIKTEPYTQKINKNKKYTENKSSSDAANETNMKDDDSNTLKNVIETNELIEKNVQNDSNNTSSLIMIPNEPDDVIIVDSTNIDYNKFSARRFIDEMINKSPDTSKFCETFNYGDLDEFKKTQLDTDKNKQNNTDLDEVLKSACQDCREYFKYVGRNLTVEEIQQKIRNCKHKMPFVLNPTPEDFWNPCFNHFSENDPRNETLIDDRFILKNKKLKSSPK